MDNFCFSNTVAHMRRLKKMGRSQLGFSYPKKTIYKQVWGRATPVCLPPCPPDLPFRMMPDFTEGVSDQMSAGDLAIVQRNAVSFYTDAERDFSDLVDGSAALHRVASEYAMETDQWAYLGIEVISSMHVFYWLYLFPFFPVIR